MAGVAAIAGNLSLDGNKREVQSPNGFTMTDASASPKVSPVATGTSEVAFVFPAKAISLTVVLPSNAGELRLVAGGATLGKFVFPANVPMTINGKAGDTVYIDRTAGTSVIYFYFDTVG